MLTALRMEAVWLRERLKEHGAQGPGTAPSACARADRPDHLAMCSHIATRLRPPVLDDLGLVDALEWFTSRF